MNMRQKYPQIIFTLQEFSLERMKQIAKDQPSLEIIQEMWSVQNPTTANLGKHNWIAV